MKFNFLKDIFDGKKRPPKTDITRRFELIGRVGQGSMSRVWRARDTLSGKIVALKVLDKEKTQRFESRFAPDLKKPSEGEVALTLKHPHIVKTYEWGTTVEGEQFLVMEFVEGLGLSYLVDVQNDVMRKHRLSFMIQLGEAIHYFHDQKWIHRDICPRNIMVTDGNHQIKLIDFGLVVPNTPPFQAPGNRTGTANYMAPELIKRLRTDQRIDIFSFAVTCFEMYTRRHPWKGAETIEAVLQHINTPALDIRKVVPEIDKQIADAIMKGLAINPADRWPTIDPMIYQFREAQERLSPTRSDQSKRDRTTVVSRSKPSKSGSPTPGISLAEDEPGATPVPRKKSKAPTPGISLAEDDSAAPPPKTHATSPGITLAEDQPTTHKPKSVTPTSGIRLADPDEPAAPDGPSPSQAPSGITLADDEPPATAAPAPDSSQPESKKPAVDADG
jgi:eukaryotic-like serine/threonine-protein kinase